MYFRHVTRLNRTRNGDDGILTNEKKIRTVSTVVDQCVEFAK